MHGAVDPNTRPVGQAFIASTGGWSVPVSASLRTGNASSRLGASGRGTASLGALSLIAALLLPLPLAGSLLLSHVLLAAIWVMWLFSSVARGKARLTRIGRLTIGLVLVFGVSIAAQLFSRELPGRFNEEMPKIALLFLGAAAISSMLADRMAKILPVCALALSASILWAWRNDSTVTVDDRLSIDGYGSPNTLAVMVAITIIILLFGRHRRSWGALRGIRWPIIGLLLAILFESASRGGIFGLIVGIAAVALRRLFIAQRATHVARLCIAAAGGLAVVMLLAASIQIDNVLTSRFNLTGQNADSGRLDIWARLIDLSANDDYALVFGHGPGSIFLLYPGKVVISAHSLPVSALYYFGILGLTFLGVWVVELWRSILLERDVLADVRLALLGCLAFSGTIDNVVLSTQALVPSALALGVVLTAGRGRRQDEF